MPLGRHGAVEEVTKHLRLLLILVLSLQAKNRALSSVARVI